MTTTSIFLVGWPTFNCNIATGTQIRMFACHGQMARNENIHGQRCNVNTNLLSDPKVIHQIIFSLVCIHLKAWLYK